MSRKIAVLDLHQADSDKPVTYVKRSVADLLVRRLLAVWVIDKQVIRHVAVRSLREFTSMKFVMPSKPYIPEHMPPVDIPGVKWIPPKPKPWQPILTT